MRCFFFIIFFSLLFSISAYSADDLFEAAHNGNTSAIELLVKNGAKIDAQDDKGWTPLGAAVWYNQTAAVKKLLALGANPNASQGKYNPILLQAATKDTEILKEILKAGANAGVLGNDNKNALNAAAGIQAHIFEKLRAKGKKHFRGKTPNAVENVKLLIAAGVDVNHQPSEWGETPLRTVIRLNKKDVMKILLNSGASAKKNQRRTVTKWRRRFQ